MSFGWALLLPISQISYIALKHSNNTHTGKKGPLLWLKLVFIEPSFTLLIFPHHHTIIRISIHTNSQSITLQSIIFNCLAPIISCSLCGLHHQSPPSGVQLSINNSLIFTRAPLHLPSPMWLFAVETHIVSSFHCLLSPFWFLNWTYSWVPSSVHRKPFLYKLDTTLLQQTLILEGTYKKPCSRRPLLWKEFILFIFSFIITTSLLSEFPHFTHFSLPISPCVAKIF